MKMEITARAFDRAIKSNHAARLSVNSYLISAERVDIFALVVRSFSVNPVLSCLPYCVIWVVR